MEPTQRGIPEDAAVASSERAEPIGAYLRRQRALREITLEQLAHDYVLGGQHSRYPVLLDGQVIGLISLSRVKAVPREQWGAVTVAAVADRALPALVIDADAPLESAASRLAGETPGALLVLSEGRLVGILTRADVIRVLNSPA